MFTVLQAIYPQNYPCSPAAITLLIHGSVVPQSFGGISGLVNGVKELIQISIMVEHVHKPMNEQHSLAFMHPGSQSARYQSTQYYG
jgi:hypothetical protein